MRDTVFISHATPEDNDFTIWLASRLQLLGYKVWIDKNALVGGEKFWEEIDQVIRNQAIKFLLVYSSNICQKEALGKLRDGIYKEYSLAESIGKQEQLTDFLLLLNSDNSPYNLFIGSDRFNQIPFYENWANGLKQLEKKFIKDKVPVSALNLSKEFNQWFQYQYIVPNPIIDKKELYYANIWPINQLPRSYYIHQFRTEEQAKHIVNNNKSFPLSRIANHISSFESDLRSDLSMADNLDIIPERIYEVRINDILMGHESELFPTYKDIENHFKALLKKVFHQLMKNRGMFWYEMSNKKLAYFFTPANLQGLKVRFKYPFRKKGSKIKNLIGIYKGVWKWHYAVSVKPILYPAIGFSLKNHLTFSNDGFQIWKTERGEIDTVKLHNHRRSKGKTFFNEEWRDMFLAFLHGLKSNNGLIEIPLSSDFVLDMQPIPETFWSKFGYFDPKDKTRQGMLSVYEDDDDVEETDNDIQIETA